MLGAGRLDAVATWLGAVATVIAVQNMLIFFVRARLTPSARALHQRTSRLIRRWKRRAAGLLAEGRRAMKMRIIKMIEMTFAAKIAVVIVRVAALRFV